MARDFSISIIGLNKGVHQFEFQLENDFFKQYGLEVVTDGKLVGVVVLDKKETFIDADFKIEGTARLVCDRSLEEFDFPISMTRKVVFKYGEEAKEVSDEVIVITHDQQALNVGQLMYEFIALEIPIKKLHPKFQQETDDDTEGSIIYSSSAKPDDENIDPRWEILKKLK